MIVRMSVRIITRFYTQLHPIGLRVSAASPVGLDLLLNARFAADQQRRDRGRGSARGPPVAAGMQASASSAP